MSENNKPWRPPGPELPPKFAFSVAELAEILGVNHKTIREQIAAEKVGSIRLGRLIRIPRSEVLKLLLE